MGFKALIVRVQFFFFFHSTDSFNTLIEKERENHETSQCCVRFFYRKTLRGIEKPLKPMSITPRDTQYFCDDESFFYQFFFMAVQKVSFFLITAYFFFVLTRLISVMSMAQFWRHPC